MADLLERQIRYNNAIAEEGLLGDYGANIGRVLLTTYGNDVSNRAKAKAAAGSDARMNGCELPVIINSGSGNQASPARCPSSSTPRSCTAARKSSTAPSSSPIWWPSTKRPASAPVCLLRRGQRGCGCRRRHRVPVRRRLSAAIHTVVNALAIVSGIVCDGAKASCAAKIASSVDAALLGYNMYKCNQEFKGGDGIVMKDIETTIKGIGRLGKDGMRQTNEEIIRLMMS
mgnify:FL=1